MRMQAFRSIYYLPLAMLAWASGILLHLALLRTLFAQRLEWGGDLQWLLLWSAIVFGFSLPFVFLPSFMVIRWVLRGCRPAAAFAVAGAVLGAVPEAILFTRFGGRLTDLLTRGGLLFFATFAMMGLIMGLGFAWIEGPSRHTRGFDVSQQYR